MIQIHKTEYWTFYWSENKDDFKETTNIFDYKWNFSLCHLPGQMIKRLNIPKNKGNNTLYIVDDNTCVIHHGIISKDLSKVYYLRIKPLKSSNKKEQKIIDSVINNKPFITQKTFLQQILPYLNDFNKEKDSIYELLSSKDKESFKLGIDLLASTNWFVENKTVIHYLLTINKYSKILQTSNSKYILNSLNYIKPYMYEEYYNRVSTLIQAIYLYNDMNWYFCRKILEPELQKFDKYIVPMEHEGRTMPKNLKEKEIQNIISLHFQGLLEIANLKIVFND